jgi:uncharacterized protein DUF4124
LFIIAFMMIISSLASGVAIAQTNDKGHDAVSQDTPLGSSIFKGSTFSGQKGIVLLGMPQILESPDPHHRNRHILIVRPTANLDRGNLNPSGLSTLNNRGTNSVKRGNLEVNKPGETKEAPQEGGKPGEESTAKAAGGGETPQVTSEEPAKVLSSSSLNKSSGLYRWKDKNGVVHATNNLGSVPPEYQNQVKESEKGKSK